MSVDVRERHTRAMQLDDTGDDREAEAATLADAVGPALEALEHRRTPRRFDAGTVIGDRQSSAAVMLRDVDLDAAAGEAVANRIVEQVAQQRAQARLPAIDDAGLRFAVDRDFEILVRRHRAEFLQLLLAPPTNI